MSFHTDGPYVVYNCQFDLKHVISTREPLNETIRIFDILTLTTGDWLSELLHGLRQLCRQLRIFFYVLNGRESAI